MRGLTARHSFTERLILAAKLDPGVYEEVEHDAGATGQAAAVVLLTSVTAGVGAATLGPFAILAFAVFSLISWLMYAGVAYFVGAKVLASAETQSSWGEVARTLGFARAPGFALIVSFLPVVGAVVGVVVFFWGLAATVVAIRAALDFSFGRALATALAAAVALGLLQLILFAAF